MRSPGRMIWSQLDDTKSIHSICTLTTIGPYHLEQANLPFGWSSMMHLYPTTRGQALELGFLDGLTGSEPETLLESRIAALQGRYPQALECAQNLFATSDSIEIKCWALMVRDICLNAAGRMDQNRELYSHYLKLEQFSQPQPTLALQCVRSLIDADQFELALGLLMRLSDLTPTLPRSDQQLLVTRAQKLRADILRKTGRKSEALSQLNEAIDSYSEFSDCLSFEDAKKNHSTFLLLETKRRLLDSLYFSSIEDRNFETARVALKVAEAIDPHCARIHLMMAELEFHSGNTESARNAYWRALELGSLDVGHISAKLRQIGLQAPASAQKTAESRHLEVATSGIASPFYISSQPPVMQAFKSHLEAVESSTRTHPLTRTLGSFIDLRAPVPESPLLSWTPWFCFQAFSEELTPYFETLTLQRAVVSEFRTELFRALADSMDIDEEQIINWASLQTLFSRSDRTHEVENSWNNRASLSELQKAMLARLLSSLGFFSDSLALLDFPTAKPSDAIERSYLLVSRHFIESIQQRSAFKNPSEATQAILASIPDAPETLRMKFSLALNSTVLAGQRKLADQVIHWREVTHGFMELIEESVNFNDFEKNLLKSRYYRAVSYAPFVTGDRKMLAEDQVLCEEHALKAQATTERQSILKRENMFPMLESSARILSFLGEYKRAREYMERIVNEVDPYDSKAWLQVGEYREKGNEHAEALQAYLRSAELGCPLGRLAWFKAGRAAEKVGKKDLARYCYFESLKKWPTGKTPYLRISALREIPNDSLALWANSVVSRLEGKP